MLTLITMIIFPESQFRKWNVTMYSGSTPASYISTWTCVELCRCHFFCSCLSRPYVEFETFFFFNSVMFYLFYFLWHSQTCHLPYCNVVFIEILQHCNMYSIHLELERQASEILCQVLVIVYGKNDAYLFIISLNTGYLFNYSVLFKSPIT